VVISFPLALWFADLRITLWETWFYVKTPMPVTSGPFLTSSFVFWGFIAAINIYTTGMCRTFGLWHYSWCLYSTTYVGMIVYRIWDAQDCSRGLVRPANGAQTAKMTHIICIIINSALGYTLVSLTLFFLLVAHSNALYITSGTVSISIFINYL